MAKRTKLVPELIPSDLWGRSASKMLGHRAVWKKVIRPDAITAAKNRCEICRVEASTLVCHDKWVYDDKKATATLSGFEIHCRDCDSVTHVGRLAKVLGPKQALSVAMTQLCKVNQCSPEAASKSLIDALAIWENRNSKKWNIKVAPDLVAKYSELAELPKFTPA